MYGKGKEHRQKDGAEAKQTAGPNTVFYQGFDRFTGDQVLGQKTGQENRQLGRKPVSGKEVPDNVRNPTEIMMLQPVIGMDQYFEIENAKENDDHRFFHGTSNQIKDEREKEVERHLHSDRPPPRHNAIKRVRMPPMKKKCRQDKVGGVNTVGRPSQKPICRHHFGAGPVKYDGHPE